MSHSVSIATVVAQLSALVLHAGSAGLVGVLVAPLLTRSTLDYTAAIATLIIYARALHP